MPPNEVVDIGPPPVLSLDTAKDRETTWFKYPLMDRLLRPRPLLVDGQHRLQAKTPRKPSQPLPWLGG